MATDARGHTVPAAADHPQRQNLLDMALSVNDPVMVADTTARTSVASALAASISASRPLIVYRADAARYESTIDGTNWLVVASATDWTAWVPAITASTTNPTLGTGSSVGGNYQYLQTLKTVIATANVTFGTSGVAVGSGRYAISLPVAAATTYLVVGSGFYTDASGPTTFHFDCRLLSSTTFAMYLDNQTAGVFGVGSGAPVVPAASDSMNLMLTYQAA